MTHSLAILVTALLFGGMTLYSFGFAALLWWSHDTMAATVMAAVALTTIPVRQLLMPAINRATDSDDRLRFKWLHGASVLVTLSHIALTGWILARIV